MADLRLLPKLRKGEVVPEDNANNRAALDELRASGVDVDVAAY